MNNPPRRIPPDLSVGRFNNRIIVGICGGAWGMEGVGKTSVAGLMDELAGFKVVSFSTPIVDFAKAHMKWDGKMDLYGRKIVDAVCRIGRKVSRDYWLNLAMHKVDPTWPKVVFDDLFFENEEWLVKSLGGKIIRVSRPSVPDAATWLQSDFTITNDGTLDDLRTKVSSLILANF